MRATEDVSTITGTRNNKGNEMVFKIHSLKSLYENGEDFFFTPKSDANFKIIWTIKGTGSCYIDLQKSPIEGNCLFFVKPGQVYQVDLVEPFEGYFISFSESFLCIEDQEFNSTYHSSLFKLFASSKGIVIHQDSGDMKNIAEKMINEFDSDNLFRGEILRRYFKILLIYITRQLEGKFESIQPTRNMEIVQQFMSLLEKNFKEQKMVADYASMLSVTPNYLNEIIKKTTGFSAGHHIRQRVVLEAKRRAIYSDNCMKEIAYFLGFCDMAHFSKFFKNTTGMNFSDFKKERRLLEGLAL
jgi:AraC family transcriptional activator of pobA